MLLQRGERLVAPRAVGDIPFESSGAQRTWLTANGVLVSTTPTGDGAWQAWQWILVSPDEMAALPWGTVCFDDPDDVFAEGATTKPGAHVPGGRGMGLALARQIARRVGGDVWVADAGGRGSADDDEPCGAVFVARLPGVLAPTDQSEDDSYSQTDEPGVTP